MRGSDERTGSLFSYVDLEARIRKDHPLRTIRLIVNETLAAMERDLAALYSGTGRPSIAPEKLLRATLLQAFYSVRSERQLMERLEFDLLFRWFVGIGVDELGDALASRELALLMLSGRFIGPAAVAQRCFERACGGAEVTKSGAHTSCGRCANQRRM